MTTIDTRQLANGSVIDADLCIIGAGAAGLSIAREFSGTAIRVCVIESGDREFRHATQSLYAGYNVGLPNFPTTSSRIRMLGGSTTAWAGQCAPLNPDDFVERPWVPHSGWPFTLQTLEPYYGRAQTLLRFGAIGDERVWNAMANRPPLSLRDEALETKIFRFCETTDFRVLHRDEIERAPNVATYLNANAVEVEPNASGTRITSVTIRTLEGAQHAVRATIFVLATGGIENVRLLLASRRDAGGIGNGAELVGRFFMDHPFLYSGVVELEDSARANVLEGYERLADADWRLAAIQFSERWLRKEQLVNCAVHLVRRPAFKTTGEYNSKGSLALNALLDALRTRSRHGFDWTRNVRRVLSGGSAIARSRAEQLGHLFRPRTTLALRVTLEHTPNPASRVYLSSERDRLGVPLVAVDWRLGEIERRSVDRFHEVLINAFLRSGLGTMELRLDEDDTGWPTVLSGGKHHMGGTRMHTDARQGVVDADCRVHGIANLYIAGSSVFPTGGYVNPTFTIIALAIRLADRLRLDLAERLRPEISGLAADVRQASTAAQA